MRSDQKFERPTAEYLRECFECREGVLYWRERPISHFRRPADHITFTKKHAGRPAGKLDSRGYMCVGMRIQGRAISMAAHRIVWALHHGRWPTQHIDHMNRIRHDNRIENLRDVAPAENVKNSARNRVYPYVKEHRWGGFSAQVRIGDRGVHIGIFATETEANNHRQMVNAALEGLAKSLAKKSKTGRKRKDSGTKCVQPPMDESKTK
jgi:hypothetical protein